MASSPSGWIDGVTFGFGHGGIEAILLAIAVVLWSIVAKSRPWFTFAGAAPPPGDGQGGQPAQK